MKTPAATGYGGLRTSIRGHLSKRNMSRLREKRRFRGAEAHRISSGSASNGTVGFRWNCWSGLAPHLRMPRVIYAALQ